MNVSLHIVQLSDKGVQCATVASTGWLFWLPRGRPAEWAEPPEPGARVSVTLPRWLALRHKQLVVLRGQFALPLIPEPGLDPEKAKGILPMADDRQDAGKGFLARNERREKPSHPEFTGKLNIRGVEYRLAAWVREKDGKKFFSIAANEIEQRPQMPPQRAAGGPTFRDEDAIPFMPERR